MESSKTDQSLLRLARRDDELAWRRIQHLYRPLFCEWCHQHAIDGLAQDNVIAEILETIRAGLGDFESVEKGAFRNWLKAISFKACADFLKNERKLSSDGQRGPVRAEESVELTVTEDTGANEQELSKLYKQAFELVISEFSVQSARIFLAYVVEEQDPEKIAKEFGVERHTIYVTKSRVLRKLRQEFEDLLEMD